MSDEKTPETSPVSTHLATCGGCGAGWTGLNTAHCGGCHRTFGSVISFDLHRSALVTIGGRTQMRRAGRCYEPETRGLRLSEIREYQCWVRPEDDSFRARVLHSDRSRKTTRFPAAPAA